MLGTALPRLDDRLQFAIDSTVGTEPYGQATDPSLCVALAAWGQQVRVEPGHVLSVEIHDAFLGVVVQGHLDKRATDGARILIIDTLRPGATFMLNPKASSSEATLPLHAVRQSVVSVLNREGLSRAIAHQPSLWKSVFADVRGHLARVEARLEDIAFVPGQTQLARLLLQLTVARGKACVSGVSQRQVACLLGMHRESVTMLLAQMREEGLVRTNRLHVEILNEDALRLMADAGTGEWLNGSLPDLDSVLVGE